MRRSSATRCRRSPSSGSCPCSAASTRSSSTRHPRAREVDHRQPRARRWSPRASRATGSTWSRPGGRRSSATARRWAPIGQGQVLRRGGAAARRPPDGDGHRIDADASVRPRSRRVRARRRRRVPARYAPARRRPHLAALRRGSRGLLALPQERRGSLPLLRTRGLRGPRGDPAVRARALPRRRTSPGLSSSRTRSGARSARHAPTRWTCRSSTPRSNPSMVGDVTHVTPPIGWASHRDGVTNVTRGE